MDGAGALLKQEIRNEQLKPGGLKLQNAAEIVQFLKDQSERVHAGPASARRTTHKFFWEIPKGSREHVNHQCRSVSTRDPTLIQFRALSCFCHVCLGYSSE